MAGDSDDKLGINPKERPSEHPGTCELNHSQQQQGQSSSYLKDDVFQEASSIGSYGLPSKPFDLGDKSDSVAPEDAKNWNVVEKQAGLCLEEKDVRNVCGGGAVLVKPESAPVGEMNGGVVSVTHELCDSGIQELIEYREKLDFPEKMHTGGNFDEGSVKRALEKEVTDDTALVETSEIGRGSVNLLEAPKDDSKVNVRKETDGNNEKKPRRRSKSGKHKIAETVEDKKNLDLDMTRIMEKKEKKVYLRKELEALRHEGLGTQKNKWVEVYCGLGPVVQKEYDELVNFNHNQRQQQPKQKNKKPISSNLNPQFPNVAPPLIFGEDSSQTADHETENINPTETASGLLLTDGNGCLVEQEECTEDYESDEDYSSIQKPAFFVTGDPDFDSGSPEDGLEYLRRVRWEAAQIPNVKIAEVDRSKLNKEQTIYMPQIPDIAKCPIHLMPLREWEDAFLADFSQLRQDLSHYEVLLGNTCSKRKSFSTVDDGESSCKLFESIVLENVFNATVADVSCQSIDTSIPESCDNRDTVSVENNCLHCNESPSSKSFSRETSGNYPTLSVILGMDFIARVSMLRKHIDKVKTLSSLSRDDSLWLFVLCAAVDSPLDADTCAALRSLLRKCASLRAEKSEIDDEVVMLNILATISGRYFGQSEN